MSYGAPVWKDQLTAYDRHEFVYDAIGNPTTYYNGTEWNFTWANGRQLVAAAKTGTNITYTYDLAGIRDSKTVNNVTYHYLTQNGQVVRQTWTEGTVDHVMDFIYDNNGAPYAMKSEKDLVPAQFCIIDRAQIHAEIDLA